MKFSYFLLPLLIHIPATLSFAEDNDSKFCIGDKTKIYSKVLEEEREILIHLPNKYDSTTNKYSVLYLLDGEWNFLHSISYVTYLSENEIIPDMILVAISTTNRVRDFLPTNVAQVPESGGSDKFLTFLEDELIPFINKNYRTKSNRILFGESNGGLFAIYSLLTQPNLFEAYIIGSPTIGHDNYFVNNLATDVFKNSNFPKKKLILTYGSDEGKWMVSQVLGFVKILKDHSPINLNYEIIELTNEKHAPPVALYEALKLLYKK
jgi:uncharacterized protein